MRGLDSHLSYRIGLRTFSAAESRTVLGVADAYTLPPVPGSAYLKFDTESLVRLRAAYVSGELPVRGQAIGGRAGGQEFALPFTLGRVRAPRLPVESAPTVPAMPQLPVATSQDDTIMGAMVARMVGQGPGAHQIWLPPLSEPPALDQLLTPLDVDPQRGLCPVGWGGNGRLIVPIAIVDKPFEQRRDLLWADLSGAAGHAIVVGAPQSGKSTLLRTLISAIALTHTPAEAQFFLLDMGGGALGSLAGLPHVSGYATRRDAQRARRVVAEVVTLLAQREQFFSANGIDSATAFRQRRAEFQESEGEGREFGDVFLVVDDWATLRHEYEQLDEAITNLAARGLGFGIHVVVSANSWMGVRATLRDAIGTRFELRLGDPADSVIDRRAAMNVPSDKPGRGLTRDKLHFLTALPRIDTEQNPTTMGEGTLAMVERIRSSWPGQPAPQVRLLPARIPLSAIDRQRPPSPRAIPIGIAEHDLKPVYLDFAADPHFLSFGDVEAGKTGLLRTIATGIMRRYSAQESAIIVVDYRRGLLDAVTGDHLLGYAGAEPVLAGLVDQVAAGMATRLPGPDVNAEALRTRSWWRGPEVFVLVDDYELVATAGRNPLAPLLEYLPQARDIGLHLVVARASGGAARSMFDPMLQRVRELGSPGVLLSGSKDEGPLLGDVKPSPQPAGRGSLVRRRTGSALVQIAWQEPSNEADSARAEVVTSG